MTNEVRADRPCLNRRSATIFLKPELIKLVYQGWGLSTNSSNSSKQWTTLENVGVVSVIIPVHNVENYVHNIFEFMNSQEYKKWELIFINDHSTDNTIREVNREKQGIIQRVIIKDNSGIGFRLHVILE